MDNFQWERYHRNIIAEGFDEETQLRLMESNVCVVGAGGLGSSVLNYLVAAGVGSITVVESDKISLSNLQRQVLYSTADIGESKAEIAARRLSSLNPSCRLNVVDERLDDMNAETIITGHDVVIDCTDNYSSRYIIDGVCERLKIPMVYGTAQDWGGQVSVFHYVDNAGKHSGSYKNLYPDEPVQKDLVGVVSPVVGIIGSMQAVEVIKIITGKGITLSGRLFNVDALTLQFNIFDIE